MNAKGKAILMIFLIITMPIYSSIVFGSVTPTYVGGMGGANNYVQSRDLLFMNVTTTSNHVTFSNRPDILDFECNSTGSCYLKNPRYLTFDTPTKNFTLTEFDVNNNPIGDATFTVKVDNSSPFANYTVYQDFSDKKIKVNFSELFDSDGQASGECSGFKYVQIKEGATIVKDLNIWSRVNESCVQNPGIISLDIAQSGRHVISVVAMDNVGNRFTGVGKEVYIDNVGPVISDFKILNPTTFQPITTISASRNSYSVQEVLVQFKLEDRNLDNESIRGNLKDLNINIFENERYGDVKFECTSPNNISYTCETTNRTPILLNPQDGNIVISVTAADKLGYSTTQSLTYTVAVDATVPGASFIGTENCDNSGQCFVSLGVNKFLMRANIGSKTLNRGLVSFDLLRMGNGDAYQVNYCEPKGSVWECYLYHQIIAPNLVEGQELEMYLSLSYDDSGSKFGDMQTKVIYDSGKPYVENETTDITYISATSGNPWILKMERVNAYLSVKDDVSGVKEVVADFSNIAEGKVNITSDSCIRQGATNEYICVFNQKFQAINSGIKEISYTLIDFAGNKKVVKSNIEILTESTSSPKFWELTGFEIVPDNGIDLVTLNYFPLDSASVWITKELKGSAGAKTLAVAFTDNDNKCFYSGTLVENYESTTGGNCDIDDCDVEILNEEVPGYANITTAFKTAKIFRSTKTYLDGDKLLLQVEFNKKNLPVGSVLKYNCPVTVVSALNGVKYSPQTINLTFGVPTYNSSYKAGEALKDKIESKKDKLKKDTYIDDMMGYIEMIQKMCTAYNSVMLIWGVLNPVEGTIAEGLMKTPPTAGAGLGLSALTNVVSKGLEEGLGKFANFLCSFVQCNLWNTVLKGEAGDNPDASIKEMIIFAITGVSTSSALATLRNDLGGSYYDISKKSIIYSVLFLCVPGVLYNMKQQRNIECEYVYCLENKVLESGIQPYLCEAKKGYAECLFVYGQVFNSMPFSIFLTMLSGMIKMFAKNPVSAVFGAVGLACGFLIATPASNSMCQVSTLINNVLNFINSVMTLINFVSNDEPVAKDYCAELDL